VAHTFFQFKSWLSYWLDAVDEHSLHSPFFFDFYTRVIKARPEEDSNPAFEKLRKKLVSDQRQIQVTDFGTGSSGPRTIADIATRSLSTPQFCSIYGRMIRHLKSRTVLELGTSLGINSLYLAQETGTTVTTFEGAPTLSEIAQLTFQFAGAKNIRLIEGNIDTTLPEHLLTVKKIDFVFIDANHRYEATLNYFRLLHHKMATSGVIVLDDIHSSPEMEKAWKEVKNHNLVYASADLFRCGILFFDPSLNKQHVILQV
jgi:predicted O-methyltransferase YrrM